MWPLSFSGFRFCKRCINAVVPNDLISHMVAEELKIIVAELIMSENKTFFFLKERRSSGKFCLTFFPIPLTAESKSK